MSPLLSQRHHALMRIMAKGKRINPGVWCGCATTTPGFGAVPANFPLEIHFFCLAWARRLCFCILWSCVVTDLSPSILWYRICLCCSTRTEVDQIQWCRPFMVKLTHTPVPQLISICAVFRMTALYTHTHTKYCFLLAGYLNGTQNHLVDPPK